MFVCVCVQAQRVFISNNNFVEDQFAIGCVLSAGSFASIVPRVLPPSCRIVTVFEKTVILLMMDLQVSLL